MSAIKAIAAVTDLLDASPGNVRRTRVEVEPEEARRAFERVRQEVAALSENAGAGDAERLLVQFEQQLLSPRRRVPFGQRRVDGRACRDLAIDLIHALMPAIVARDEADLDPAERAERRRAIELAERERMAFHDLVMQLRELPTQPGWARGEARDSYAAATTLLSQLWDSVPNEMLAGMIVSERDPATRARVAEQQRAQIRDLPRPTLTPSARLAGGAGRRIGLLAAGPPPPAAAGDTIARLASLERLVARSEHNGRLDVDHTAWFVAVIELAHTAVGEAVTAHELKLAVPAAFAEAAEEARHRHAREFA